MSNTIAFKILGVVWSVTAVKSFLPICAGWSEDDSTYDATDNQNLSMASGYQGWVLAGYVYCEHSFKPSFAIPICFTDFFIPCIVIIPVYALIFRRIRERSKLKQQKHLPRPKTDSDQLAHERKAAIMLGIIIGFFIVCWLPYFIDLFVCSVYTNCRSLYSKASQIFTWLGYANTCVNPCVYAGSNPNFRKYIFPTRNTDSRNSILMEKKVKILKSDGSYDSKNLESGLAINGQIRSESQ